VKNRGREQELKRGLEAFHAGDFSRAVPLLTSALEKTADQHLKTILRIRLFECYLEAGDYARARETAEGEPIDDGYFFLLRARSRHHNGNYRQAEQALVKAQTTKSVFADKARKEAVYLWAVNRQAMYRRKPNMENKGLALRAWKNFTKAFCADDATDKRCTEAARHIARLGN
jgi:thioredoxin-like negative regulator of GroEL